MSAGPLTGARIALTGARKAQETADYVRRLGGIPLIAPVLATLPRDAADLPRSTDPGQALDRLLTEDVALIIFLTGVGVRALLQLADRRGQLTELLSVLSRLEVVARGPKARGALKGAGVEVAWQPVEATDAAIVEGLDRFALAGRAAAVQWAGFADERLRLALIERATDLIELDLYRHVAPRDEAPVLALFDALRGDGVDFLTFTSAIGVRGLFAIAERHGRDDELATSLRDGRVVTVAVGPVTSAALTDAGVPADLVPEAHTTGGMLRAIGQWLASRRVVAD